MANEVTKLNGIAIANITDLNGITDANLDKINGQEFTGTRDIATITAYAQAGGNGGASYGANLAYDEDNNYVYVQYPRNGGGGAAVVGSFNSSNQNVDWGSEQTIVSSAAFSSKTCEYDKYNNRVWTAWIGGSGNILHARCGTIGSDKSISWGTTLEVEQGYNTYSRYNQGILGQNLAVDQNTGKVLLAWNSAANGNNISGASSHHPVGVILTVDTSDNSITASSQVRLATGGSGQSFPMIQIHFDDTNDEWVGITDANGSGTGIHALRITNNSGSPSPANQTQLTGNSSHFIQGDGNHNANNGAVGGRYGGLMMVHDLSSDRFIMGSATADGTTPKLFAFQNTGSGITWDTTGFAVSHGTTISQSGKGGTIAYSHARGRFATHGQDGDEKLEVFSYTAAGGFVSHNASSLITISTDDDPFFQGGASMTDMSAFADGATMIVGGDYDSRKPYYIIIEMGG